MQPIDPHIFRQAASRFVTGVTVLTALDAHGVCGMTANSFVTVSLAPPTVLVSVKPGRMHDAIAAGRRYGVNVLPQEARELSFAFSGRTRQDRAIAHELCDGLPRLDGCVAFFACELTRSVAVGDHTLFIAHVSRCAHSEATPLVFFASRYHLGPGLPV